MRIILITLLLLLGLTTKLHAQSHLFGPSVSYQYQKGSIVKTGIYYATAATPTNVFKIDGTANFTWVQDKYTVIPEIALAYYTDMYFIGAFGRAEVTPYTLTPKVGVTLLTFVELDLGYGFPIADKSNYRPIKGFTASLRFNFPINFLKL
ncbi:hypothetical protein [Myroides injenensis]|uniref:hypothetical protein n=1 Tax=Myroides injenensis TaxID=1183151 RepID=UPI000287AB4F|nr:hypothetical protein [Myroides injenensis]